MSSGGVRQIFKAKLAAFTVPYIDTINMPVGKPSQHIPEWITCSFFANSNDVTTFCRDIEEDGTVEIYIFTEAGKGDSTGLQIAHDLTLFLDAWTPTPVTVESIDAPQEMNDGDQDGFYYGLTLAVNYSLRY